MNMLNISKGVVAVLLSASLSIAMAAPMKSAIPDVGSSTHRTTELLEAADKAKDNHSKEVYTKTAQKASVDYLPTHTQTL